MKRSQAGSGSSFSWGKTLEDKATRKQVELYLVERGMTLSRYIRRLLRRDSGNRASVLNSGKGVK